MTKTTKRLISIPSVLLIFALIFSLMSFAAYMKGDVNNDASITTLDARLVLIESLSPGSLAGDAFAAADYDDNGSITTSDARYVLLASLGLGGGQTADETAAKNSLSDAVTSANALYARITIAANRAKTSVSSLNSAITASAALVASANSTVEVYNQSKTDLLAAMAAVTADTSILIGANLTSAVNALYTTVSANQSDYTSASWSNVAAAYAAVNATIVNSGTDAQGTTLYNNLFNAIEALEFDTDITVSLAGGQNITASNGGTFSVPVSVSANSNLLNAQIIFSYDSALLRLDSVTGTGYYAANTTVAGSCEAAFITSTALTEETVMFTLNFTVISAAVEETFIGATTVELVGSGETALTATYDSGIITLN